MTCGDVLENCAVFRGMPPKDVEQLRWGMRRAIVFHVHVIGLNGVLVVHFGLSGQFSRQMLVASVDGLEQKGMNPSDAPVCPFWTFGALSQVVLAGELLNKLCGLIVWKSVSLVGDGCWCVECTTGCCTCHNVAD